MKFIIGTKQGMTQVFSQDGTVVPVTRVQAGPCLVSQIKMKSKDRVDSVQIGYGTQKTYRLSKPEQGHLKDLSVDGNTNLTVKFLKDFRVEKPTNLKRGDYFTVDIFSPGEKVQVVGTSKGKGFQGGVKRYGFKGALQSHGVKDQLRMPGSIGATGPQKVFKGTRMAGHMGDQQVTVKNLEVVEIHPETNELLLKGAVPGARGGLVYISTNEGEIEIKQTNDSVSVENNDNISDVSEAITTEDVLETEVATEVAKEENTK